MRAVIQRVREAAVTIDGELFSGIGQGLCCLIGVESGDADEDIDYICRKIMGLRIFDDPGGIMNIDVGEAGGDILLVSQFTLLGDAKKGRRPSYSSAEQPHKANELFDDLVKRIAALSTGKVATGKFQAMMDVSLVNHGPVTILLDSRKHF